MSVSTNRVPFFCADCDSELRVSDVRRQKDGRYICGKCQDAIRRKTESKRQQDLFVEQKGLFNPSRRNVEGFTDQYGFHPIRASKDYNEFLAGDFEPTKAQTRKREREQKDWEQKETKSVREASDGPKKTLAGFVRARGGIVPGGMFAGEIRRLGYRETGSTGLINQHARQGSHKQTAEYVMDAANVEGYRDRHGERFTSIGDFLSAVETSAVKGIDHYKARGATVKQKRAKAQKAMATNPISRKFPRGAELLSLQMTAQHAQHAALAASQKHGYGSAKHRAAELAYKKASQRYQRAKAKGAKKNPHKSYTRLSAARSKKAARIEAKGRKEISVAALRHDIHGIQRARRKVYRGLSSGEGHTMHGGTHVEGPVGRLPNKTEYVVEWWRWSNKKPAGQKYFSDRSSAMIFADKKQDSADPVIVFQWVGNQWVRIAGRQPPGWTGIDPQRRRNSDFFTAETKAKAKRVQRIRPVTHKQTGEQGQVVPGGGQGFVKVKWDRGATSLVKRSELKLRRGLKANPKGKLDAFERKHLAAWLRDYVSPGDRQKAKSDIYRAVVNDPEVLKRNSWDEMRDFGRRLKENPNPTNDAERIRRLRLLLAGRMVEGLKMGDSGLSEDWIRQHLYALEQQEDERKCRIRERQKKRKNPGVSEVSKMFQGKADGKVAQLYAANGAPANLARAGKLVFLKGKGWAVAPANAVVAISSGGKLWVCGTSKGSMFADKAAKGTFADYGEVSQICYETAKSHIGEGETYEYVHSFGEDGGRKPHLLIDSEGMPILRGGDYKVKAEGIVN